MHRLEIRRPDEFSPEEKSRFAKFVELGGEVAARWVLDRLDSTISIVQYFHADDLAGTAALKVPRVDHWKGCFEKAQVAKLQKQFPWELGYVRVDDKNDLQGRGLSHLLVAAALSARDGKGVYATSELSNLRMHQVLRSRQFERVGDSYKSKDRDVRLGLFVLRGRQ